MTSFATFLRSVIVASIISTSVSVGLLAVPTTTIQETAPRIYNVTVTFPLEEDDVIYKDHLEFSVDNPNLKLTDVKIQTEPVNQYDPVFKETKKVFTSDVVAQLTIQALSDEITDANLHVSYYQKSHKKIVQERLPLVFSTKTIPTQAITEQSPTIEEQKPAAPNTSATQAPKVQQTAKSSWASYLSLLFTTTSSWWFRLLLAFVMGVLLSLTPCIYPMIPITVAILQSHGKRSMWYNFLFALAYTMGIATTFATLGLVAAYTGSIFGTILNNPLVIVTIVAFFVYLAGSMLGLYEMYLPRWMQNSSGSKQGGSALSAFLFGAVSGTIASPCLTPGLLFLLTYVCQLQSLVLGFVLLFVFGIGTSMPLLIIGTFSNAIQFLPNAGMWMVEVKKLFGFILLGMSIYFLKGILPLYVLYLLTALLIAAAGVFYLYEATRYVNKNNRLKKFFGMLLIIAAVPLIGKSYLVRAEQQNPTESSIWLEHYGNAKATAIQQNKKLLVFISGPFCSICKLIETKFFQNNTVITAMDQIIPIKIKDTQNMDESSAHLLSAFTIKGVPTILLLNPTDETEIKRWGSELYDKTPEEFIAEL